ncbi:MAG: Lrp/AsnC family transcriptional regulator [Tannerella sp.]|jgi:predicted HTH transcriptional regulator|nr:Lrp/AsnC family transcriptional regulator [Tannerella sp.]
MAEARVERIFTGKEVIFESSIDKIKTTFMLKEKALGNQMNEPGGQTARKGSQTGWSDNYDKIIHLIKKNLSISRKEISKNLNNNSSAVQEYLEKIKKSGVLKREGTFDDKWIIINNI